MRKKFKQVIIAFIVITVCSFWSVINPSAANNGVASYSTSLYYGREALSKMSNGNIYTKAYDALLRGVNDGQEVVFIYDGNSTGVKITLEEMEVVLASFRFDNPQFFWVKTYSYVFFKDNTETNEDNIIKEIKVIYDSGLNTDEKRGEFAKAVDTIIKASGVNSSMSEYQRSKALHDILALNVEYIDTANAHNAYGAIVEGKAVCEGYAEAYQYLLYLSGIRSHIITGVGNSEAHAWNLVRIDGEYYQTDVTWDDQGIVYYSYFNITTERMTENHSINNNGYPLPECTSTKAGYYNNSNGNGSTFDKKPSIDDLVNQLKNNNFARVYYTGNDSMDYREFHQWVVSNISSVASGLDWSGGYKYGTRCVGREYHVYIGEPTKITGAVVSVGDDFSVTYYAEMNKAHTDVPSMRFTFNGTVTEVKGVYDKKSGAFKFTLGGILPQQMTENIRAELLLSDNTVTSVEKYSIRKYCLNLMNSEAGSELKSLLADILEYGNAAQNHTGNKNEPANKDVSGKTPYETVIETDKELQGAGYKDGTSFASAGLLFDGYNRLYFILNTPKGVSGLVIDIQINGGTPFRYTKDDLEIDSNGNYYISTGNIGVLGCDDVFVLTMYKNNVLCQKLQYSYRSFVNYVQDKNNTLSYLATRAYVLQSSLKKYVDGK